MEALGNANFKLKTGQVWNARFLRWSPPPEDEDHHIITTVPEPKQLPDVHETTNADVAGADQFANEAETAHRDQAGPLQSRRPSGVASP